jgi:predicted ATP-dependent protease
MLREEIVEAVREGKFNIYPVSTIDEEIELLTGIEASEGNTENKYPLR